tara:strand:+ start:50 stop:154 length:105 start_codon:yes stop_codon:yes gene_type:complete
MFDEFGLFLRNHDSKQYNRLISAKGAGNQAAAYV